MATLLVIGGTGFFGKSILDSYSRKLLNFWKINKVIIMSRSSHEFEEHYPELCSKGVEFLIGDISTIDFLPDADFVIHAAASSNPSKYSNYSDEEKNNIIDGTSNYCRLAKKFHKKSKIVYCSSGAVYGYQPGNIQFLKEDYPFGDISKLDNTKKSYAYAKRNSEITIKLLGEKNINVAIARCFSFVGRYLPKDQNFAIGNFIADGIKGNEINVKTNRIVSRSYMYADDLVKWLLTIADNSKPTCPIYNVASDKEIEIRELAKITSQIFNVNIKTLEIDENANEDRYIPSIEKAKKELNLRINYGLEESILRSIDEN